jgi:hypothetical protein
VITNETQLAVAQQRLDSYRQMLETTRRHLQETNSSLFPSASEGYLRRIEELQDEITAYLRERPAESAVSVRLSGPAMQPGIVRATLVSNLITGLQSALYQVGRTIAPDGSTEDGTSGVKGLHSSLRLNLIATRAGSFVLAMDLAPRQLSLLEEYEFASSAVENLIGHVNQLQEDPYNYNGGIPTLRGLQKVASLVKRDVEAIQIVYREQDRRAEAVFTPTVRERIELLLGAPEEGERTVRGALIEIDTENNTCKVHPEGEARIDCAYEEDIEDDLIAGLKKQIEMAGQFVETGRPGRYRITKIERFRVLDTEEADLD